VILKGKAHKYGDNVDTDVILPAQHMDEPGLDGLTKYCMSGIDPDFIQRVKPGDVIVAQKNFGCGSSREQAPLVIKRCGVSLIVAASFARIFFRNAINIGLPILECPEAADETRMGDDLEIDFNAGSIVNHTRGKTYRAKSFPDFIVEIIHQGGLIPYTRKQLEARGSVSTT